MPATGAVARLRFKWRTTVQPSSELMLGVSVSSASAGCWVLYYRWKDSRRPEPLWMLAAAVAGGLVAVPAGALLYRAVEWLGYRAEWELLAAPDLLASLGGALLIGAVEESVKLLPVLAISRFSRHFDELLDGMVYAPCAGLGFATAESWLMAAQGGSEAAEVLARGLAAPLTHSIFAAPAGLGLALAVLQKKWWALAAGLAVTIAAHAGYDWLLARPGLGSPAAALLVLLLWIWVLRMAPKLAATQPLHPGHSL